MNNSTLMIAVVAAPLLAGVSGVLAQPGDARGGASVRQTEAQPNRNREATGQAPQNESRENQNAEWPENRTKGNKATNGATEERRLEQNRVTKERKRDKDRNRATTGQGATPTK